MNYELWLYPGRHDPLQPLASSLPTTPEPVWVDQFERSPDANQYGEHTGEPILEISAVVPFTDSAPLDYQHPEPDGNLFGEHLGEGIHVVVDPSADTWLPPMVEDIRALPDPNGYSESAGEVHLDIAEIVPFTDAAPLVYQPAPPDPNLYGEHTGEGIHVVVDPSADSWLPPVVEDIRALPDANRYSESTGEVLLDIVEVVPFTDASVLEFQPTEPDPNFYGEHIGETPRAIPTVVADLDTWFVVPPEYQPLPWDQNLFSEHTGEALQDVVAATFRAGVNIVATAPATGRIATTPAGGRIATAPSPSG